MAAHPQKSTAVMRKNVTHAIHFMGAPEQDEITMDRGVQYTQQLRTTQLFFIVAPDIHPPTKREGDHYGTDSARVCRILDAVRRSHH
jgi:hypothetical protein